MFYVIFILAYPPAGGKNIAAYPVGSTCLGVDDDKVRQELLAKALPQGRHFVERARGRGSGVRAGLVREVHPLLRDLLPCDAPVTLDGGEESLLQVWSFRSYVSRIVEINTRRHT